MPEILTISLGKIPRKLDKNGQEQVKMVIFWPGKVNIDLLVVKKVFGPFLGQIWLKFNFIRDFSSGPWPVLGVIFTLENRGNLDFRGKSHFCGFLGRFLKIRRFSKNRFGRFSLSTGEIENRPKGRFFMVEAELFKVQFWSTFGQILTFSRLKIWPT